jgi:hypothetical protein
MIERQKAGLCLLCGSSQHRVAMCPKREKRFKPGTPRQSTTSRPPTPGRGRVNFAKVASVTEEETLALVREGDVMDDEDAEVIVDAFLASEEIADAWDDDDYFAYFAEESSGFA